MSRKHVKSLMAAAALTLTSGWAYSQGSVAMSAAEGGNLWFVELAGAPEADGNSKAAVKSEKDAFRKSAAAAGVKFKERRAYDVLFNGFAVHATPAERALLAKLPGFKAMYPVGTVQAPKPEAGGQGSAPEMAAAVALTGANIAQTRGVTGAGIKVGIIDTGIDIDHPDLGGGGVAGGTAFPSARVRYGFDFVGDAYDANTNPNPVPDANPDDCNGHGTHVAGIVGANGAIKGVAPGVTFGAYRVFGCDGSTSDDVILAALERALADGMDVVNQSLGSARQWPQYPTAVATSRLSKRGVIVVASIGNNGPQGSTPDGLYAAGAPGVGSDVIGVASFDNAQRAFTVGATPFGYNPATGSPLPPTSGSLPLARTSATLVANDGCAALPAGSLTGTAVLIRRGTCTFYTKAFNAQAAGAAAVVLFNNAAGALSPTVAGAPAITIPVVAVTAAQGAALNAAIAAGPASLTWGTDFVGYPFGTGGLISGFSSFGLAADLSVKPNIGAPGGAIFSTYPLEEGGYATLSGTSMSSPHVAGGAALVLQARPRTSPARMKTLLQNTADPKAWGGNPGLGFLDHVHRQGAGMMDIVGAIDTRTTVEPSEIAVGESSARPFRQKLKIRAAAGSTYDLSHVAALATGPFTFVQAPGLTNFAASAGVAFSAASVTVPAGEDDAEVSVTITPPDGTQLEDKGIYGGYIVLTPRDGGAPLRVPYAGFKGDYQSIQVLAPTANGFPWLAQLSGGFFNNMPTGASYTMAGDDIPFFLIHLDHHSERVLLEALDAATGNVVGRVSLDEWVTRNGSPTGFFAFAWDGQVFKKDPAKLNQWSVAPNGSYIVRVTVTKALADKKNPAHFETWSSPVITVARP
ncbi:Peptidase S8 [Rubrivivax sp. A210]|uniref:S8 family serine peptidase n=1 Tax=Rubrivivax sp. A210 TaxID=2772301 RepID=UPI0019B9CFBC|nr:S8 family serine peptidase [Rubrivivax sp. A210]CAD5369226.1 Peptidase S8 [Rubrivivax sp. A210]